MPPFVPRAVTRRARDLIPPGSTVVVGCSGGPDSQALLSILASLAPEHGWCLHAAGLNHGLRAEAAAELDLAEALAESLGIPFRRRELTLGTRGNILDNARKARYEAMRAIARDVGATRIAVGHTRSDQAETVLHRLTRGSGLRGLGGIPVRRGAIVRPLIDIGRPAIEAYLEERGISFAQDPSNRDQRRTRSVLRHTVLPALEDLNPQIERTLARFGRQAREDDRLLSTLAQEHLTARLGVLNSLDVERFTEIPRALRPRVLRRWLEAHGLPPHGRSIRALLRGISQGELRERPAQVLLDRGRLWTETAEGYDLALGPGDHDLPHLGTRLSYTTQAFQPSVLPGESVASDTLAVAFDQDRLHVGLRVRPWQHGDRFRPYGFSGHSKVGDLFTNEKVPRPLRNHWPVVVHGDDIIWVVGLRRGDFAPVEADSKRVSVLRVTGALANRAW